MIITSKISVKPVCPALYRAGDQVVLAIDPQQACFVVADQHSNHVKVQRPNQPAQEYIRQEDVRPISLRQGALQ